MAELCLGLLGLVLLLDVIAHLGDRERRASVTDIVHPLGMDIVRAQREPARTRTSALALRNVDCNPPIDGTTRPRRGSFGALRASALARAPDTPSTRAPWSPARGAPS